jgi:hypothetical protein
MNSLNLENINLHAPYIVGFDGYEQQKKYAIKTYDVRSTDAEGRPTSEYVALIIQRTNPQLDEIICRFNSEIAMFNEFKP